MPAASNPPRVLTVECPGCGTRVDDYCWRAIIGDRTIPGVCWARVLASGAPKLPDYRDAIPT